MTSAHARTKIQVLLGAVAGAIVKMSVALSQRSPSFLMLKRLFLDASPCGYGDVRICQSETLYASADIVAVSGGNRPVTTLIVSWSPHM